MDIQLEEQIGSHKKLIRFLLSCRQWDSVNLTTVDQWIDNFPDELPGRYYATKLLSQLIYYSEDDLEQLLYEGIYNRILGGDHIAEKQINHTFAISQHDLQYDLDEELHASLFVPLLDAGAPYESGNQVSRALVQRLGIKTNQVMTADKLTDFGNMFNKLIIVDDCIGSGDQCRKYWYETQVQDGRLLSQWCNDQGIKPYYLVLVGYQDSISSLKAELPELEICCVELLQDENRIFHESNTHWADETEFHSAKSYLTTVAEEFGIPFLGYKDMDFLVIMHRTIPDWTLPMLWKGTADWNFLMRRKNSLD